MLNCQMGRTGNWRPGIETGSKSKGTGLGIRPEWWPLKLELARIRVWWIQIKPYNVLFKIVSQYFLYTKWFHYLFYQTDKQIMSYLWNYQANRLLCMGLKERPYSKA